MRKKVLFILPSLAAGGAERVISFVSQNLDSKKFDITLMIIARKSSNAYKLDKGLKTIHLNKDRVLKAIPLIFQNIAVMKPDIIVGSISHLNIVLAIISIYFRKNKFIAREATVSGKRNEKKTLKESLYNKLIKITYPLLDKIICQSEDMKADLVTTFNIPENKIIIINNPITNDQPDENSKRKIDYSQPIKFITIGRLVKVKGYLRILKLLSTLTFDFTYTIIGDGPLKNKIFKAIDEYGLKDKITYISYTKDINKHLINSDYFLQGSYVEGFPNALLESCAVGTPAIAYNAPGGTNEIIINGINGYIVNSDKEFSQKLYEFHEWNTTLVKSSVFQKFEKKIILEKYTDLFLSI